MKPLHLYITEAKDYEGQEFVELEFDDRKHLLVCGQMAIDPWDWAGGHSLTSVHLNTPISPDAFYFYLARIRRSVEAPLQSVYPVWANVRGVLIDEKWFEFGWHDWSLIQEAYEDWVLTQKS